MSRASFSRSHTSSFRRDDSGNSTRREDAKSINRRAGCWQFNERLLANHAGSFHEARPRRFVASESNVAEDSLGAHAVAMQ